MMLRYFCSFLSGWILWADVVNDAPYMQEVIAAYIPALSNLTGSTLAVVYSLVYNGVYMIPEIILTCVVGFLLVQFAASRCWTSPSRPNRLNSKTALRRAGGLFFVLRLGPWCAILK